MWVKSYENRSTRWRPRAGPTYDPRQDPHRLPLSSGSTRAFVEARRPLPPDHVPPGGSSDGVNGRHPALAPAPAAPGLPQHVPRWRRSVHAGSHPPAPPPTTYALRTVTPRSPLSLSLVSDSLRVGRHLPWRGPWEQGRVPGSSWGRAKGLSSPIFRLSSCHRSHPEVSPTHQLCHPGNGSSYTTDCL